MARSESRPYKNSLVAVTSTESMGLVPLLPRLCVVGRAHHLDDAAARADALARLRLWCPDIPDATARSWASALNLIPADMVNVSVDQSETRLPPVPSPEVLKSISNLRALALVSTPAPAEAPRPSSSAQPSLQSPPGVGVPPSSVAPPAPASSPEPPIAGEQDGAADFYIAVEAGSLGTAGIGESIEDARLDAARHRRALDESFQGSGRTAVTAPLSKDLQRWAADLLVFRLVDGQP